MVKKKEDDEHGQKFGDVMDNMPCSSGLSLNVAKKKVCVFKEPESECIIEEASKKKFTVNSKRKIRWAVNMYNDW